MTSEQIVANFLPGMLPRDGGITTAPDATQALIRAISRYWVIQAMTILDFGGGISGVESFRQSVLGGHLLEADQIDRWIYEQEERDGEPSWWLSGVSLNDEDYQQEDGGTIRLTKPIRIDWRSGGLPQTAHERPAVSRRKVLYITPELPRTGRPVRDGGMLDNLRRLSLSLADDYHWEPEQATAFVLTGLVPYNIAWARQIEIMRVNGRRPREMSIKHLELACFTAEHEGQTLAARMTIWNEIHPKWAYTGVTNFGRDSRQAITRLEERMGAETSAAEPEPTPSLEDTRYAFEHEFGPGKPDQALWATDINRIAEERRKTEDTEQVRSEHLAELVLSIRHWQERGETEHVRQMCETLVDRCMPEFQRRTFWLRYRPELREDVIAAMIEQLVLEARNPNEVFMTKNFGHYLRTLCIYQLNRVLRQAGLNYRGEISDSRDALGERMGTLQEEQILLNLPDPLDRQIMVLRVLEGLQWEDIARICGKSERDLRRRFEEARTVLAAQLTADPEQAPSGEELGATAHDE